MATKILRLPDVINRVGLKRSTIYQLIETGVFPKQLKLGERSSGWLESEIENWLQTRIGNRAKTKSIQSKDRL